MPKRTDLHRIFIIGSGPIVIGQACEFDYSGSQACKALREEGYEVILINSNPATIMTDPEMADRTYVEPLTVETCEKIIQRERPDALLPTVGGQTGLNLAMDLAEAGILDRYGVELIGAKQDAIRKAEDRGLFKEAMLRCGLEVPRSKVVHSLEEARDFGASLNYNVIVRPAFTLGGSGAGISFNREEFDGVVQWGLDASPIHEVLIEESVLGWKEFELEVMRDLNDNVVIICSIENLDPMGIHTGDSITIAPAQTLTDKEYQRMRDAAIACIREIGVDTGGSNIQFAVHPETGRMVLIEMNPRVSRSSALASKATGFPIAKIAAKLAVAYTLDEIPNDITRETPASFEPTIDYVVTKVPRWAFEKFPGADDLLTVQMKSVGEVMSIGRTFKESLQKALRGLEIGRAGLGYDGKDKPLSGNPALQGDKEALLRYVRIPRPDRLFQIAEAFRAGATVEEIHASTHIDPWFLRHILEIVNEEKEIRKAKNGKIPQVLRRAKKLGFSDRQLAFIWNTEPAEIRNLRYQHRIIPAYKLVDTCAAEFEAYTPYYYSCYDDEDEARPSDKDRIVILGGGPNRIGQGIEFDYCCCHASIALREDGYETIMVNSNPETVSTDYDTSDRLYFEPVTFEDVMHIVEREKPKGVIVQFGGQTPLNLAEALWAAGAPIIGTTPRNIARAEDRKLFRDVVVKLGLLQPANETARSVEEACAAAKNIGYPVVVRPSFVLGGRAMEIVYDQTALERYMRAAVDASPEHPVLIDRFLENAIEIDVDAVSDGEDVIIAGIMQHIEEAGIHSGDSACILPPYDLPKGVITKIREQTIALAKELEVVGLMNIQFAICDGQVYLLEVNPRASRTVPFVSKATGLPLAKVAARCMTGKKLKDMGIFGDPKPRHYAAKEVVLPFIKFPGVDIVLGPEMRSTGEVMGIDWNMGLAYAKSQIAAGNRIPQKGAVFLSLNDRDKNHAPSIGKDLSELGFRILATQGTAKVLQEKGIAVEKVYKVGENRPHIVDRMINGEVDWVINTPLGGEAKVDEKVIRRTAIERGIPIMTTVSAARAGIAAIKAMKENSLSVLSLQEHYA
ncbi:MAG TPA: carbamoyl-phosphate synthase large subunit [Candidatus Hydrogenedentes bacterium]|nr:carbamoyl-phosphate synthase large subunit [Candidatus Hydrogenedentota bacterium]HOL76602.1 carbamoyl-phosphate synthase large subunit [Candidatus Hydrogenedentota bacterium]HPO84435.1 carbamoyl-phosphate synthase large subunit [Candidatus Hydrogenedentota bacterium]